MRAISAILVSIIIILSGVNCGDSKSKIIGKWENNSDPNKISILELLSDNTYVMSLVGKKNSTVSGKWTILDDKRLKLETTTLGTSLIMLGSINGDDLRISHEGITYNFKKLK
jgi:hypothetical protein